MEKLKLNEERRKKVWKEVLKWKHVTPSFFVDEMYSQYTSAREKTLALSDVYINIRPQSSWQHLVGTLYHQSELAPTKEAKSFLIQADGECVFDITCSV